MSITLDDAQKSAQIVFYLTVGFVTVLTFLRAKKGFLSNVNTEYHKKVIERLEELSKTLIDEYDFDSPNHWSKRDTVNEAVKEINKDFIEHKEAILRKGTFTTGIATNPDHEHLANLVRRIRSDPFIPAEIRDKAVDLLGNRADVIIEVHIEQLRRYCDELAKGEFNGIPKHSEAIIHNRVLDELRRRGCGIAEIEEEVHKLRFAIQEYFRKFHP